MIKELLQVLYCDDGIWFWGTTIALYISGIQSNNSIWCLKGHILAKILA